MGSIQRANSRWTGESSLPRVPMLRHPRLHHSRESNPLPKKNTGLATDCTRPAPSLLLPQFIRDGSVHLHPARRTGALFMARRGHGGIVGRTIARALVRVGWIAVRERRLLRGCPANSVSTGADATFCTCVDNYSASKPKDVNSPWTCVDCPTGQSKTGSKVPSESGESETCGVSCSANQYFGPEMGAVTARAHRPAATLRLKA